MVAITILDVVYTLLPAIICYTTSFICRINSKSGSSVAVRPPGYVFAIAWAFLFILLGISWAIAMRNTQTTNPILTGILYSLLILSLAAWIITYGCANSKTGAAWILVISIMLTAMCLITGNYVSKILLCPLLAWLIFALIMNSIEVQNKGTK